MQRVKLNSLWAIAIMLSFALVAGSMRLAYLQWQSREPDFHDNFDQDSNGIQHQKGWEAFGGTWQVQDGAMQNLSDDRGAKLVNGDPHWRDYVIDADVQLLSETGDAGFVFRTNNEEIGVDSYDGYFAGLRDLDDTLILGRADFGWHEYMSVPIHSRVRTRTWYHLTVIAVGCTVAARTVTPEGKSAIAAVNDEHCIRQGRFGLQSYSTGAVWRHVDLRPATQRDLEAILAGTKPAPPYPPLIDASGLPLRPALTNADAYQKTFAPMRRELQDNHADLNATPIAALRLLPPNVSPHVTVHGVVTLVSPLLFIQDSTGAIAVPAAHPVIPVQIGDAVEASGDAELHNFSSILRNATVRLLWSHTQVPPVAVTAAQAATGAFDSQFVETEGRLTSIAPAGPRSVRLQLDEGNQSFLAATGNGSNAAPLPALRPGSRLRLRGICVTDKAFTRDEVPFALLLRSGGDIQMLAPPPWWNTAHILELAAGLLLFLMGIQVLYTSFQRSRLHAVMEERERLAMEMHDTLAQSFAGLGFQLEALCEEAQPESSLRTQLQSTLGLVRFGHMQARRNISALRPANLELFGLAKALEQTARSIIQSGRIAIDLSIRGVPRQIPLHISDPLFRIGQEAIANAVRHGHPERIRIRLLFTKSTVQLTVQDNGQGFSVNEDPEGFGIRSMTQRAERIAASFRVRSLPGVGTVVMVRATSPRRLVPEVGHIARILKEKYFHS